MTPGDGEATAAAEPVSAPEDTVSPEAAACGPSADGAAPEPAAPAATEEDASATASAPNDDTPAVTATNSPPPLRQLLGVSLLALGVVYGDIGTSPLYAMRECFNPERGLAVGRANVLGICSLIFWALTLVVSTKYLSYVLRADNRGEGGILALMALAIRSIAKGRVRTVVILLGLFGAALLYGDGIITPAISVLSAMEGLHVASPMFDHWVVPITLLILVALFTIQRRGTAAVGAIFGPITLVWFAVLSVLGVHEIILAPEVLWSLSPHHAVRFFLENGVTALLVLGAVFLVVTGGEALYADMGHFGAKPIRITWFSLVLPALVLNYFGQGALLLHTPDAVSNPFYRMAPSWALYPLVVLATLATIIASQAVISGAFSLTRQAVMLGYFPRVKIEHTSAKEIGQIYVPVINWALLVATVALVLGFRSSSSLAGAYGIAVTTTMIITALLAAFVARRSWHWGMGAVVTITILFLIPDLAFFAANIVKIVDGGWVPLLVAALVFTSMATWKRGRDVLAERFTQRIIPIEDLFEVMHIERPARVPGTALFLTSNPSGTPPALLLNMMHNRVVHQRVILLTVVTEEDARVEPQERLSIEHLDEGFVRMIARFGFMETPNLPELLTHIGISSADLAHTTFFLGRETLLAEGGSSMAKWRERLFALMSRNATQATAFFDVPGDRVIEVGAHIEL